MKRMWAVAGIMAGLIALAACGGAESLMPMAYTLSAPTNTLNPTEMAFAMTRDVINATATGAVVELEREQQKATNVVAEATADAARFEATQAEYARQATAQAYEAGMTRVAIQATEQAVRATEAMVQATQAAQATTDAMALMVAQWTVTADAELAARAAMAWSGTATADASDATATAVYLGMISTEQANVLRLSNERQEKVNELLAFSPYVVGILASGLMIWLFVMLVRSGLPVARVIPRDARGDIPVIIGPNGVYVDMDRNAGPLLNAKHPEYVDPGLQERVTARDQAVDLAHRGAPWQARMTAPQVKAPAPAPAAAPAATTPQYRLFAPGQQPPVPSNVVEILDADWKEAEDGQ